MSFALPSQTIGRKIKTNAESEVNPISTRNMSQVAEVKDLANEADK